MDSNGNMVWTYSTNTQPGSISNPLPTRGIRLKNGNSLISYQYDMQVIEVDPNMNLVWSRGEIGVAGTGFDMLKGS